MATRGKIEAGNSRGARPARDAVAGTVANLTSASQQILGGSEKEILFHGHMNRGNEECSVLIQGSFLWDSYAHDTGRSLRRAIVYRTDRR